MKMLAAILAIVLIPMFIYGAWTIARKWNYSLGYEGMVRETVCEMIKPEHLKQPCDGGAQ